MKSSRQAAPAPPPQCPLDDCLGFIEMSWVPRIMWYLRIETLRFGDLRRSVGGISSKVLTERLRLMERLGVVSRTVLPTSPPQVEYALTELGRAFDPVFDEMVRVGARLRRDHPEALPAVSGRRR